MKLADYLKSNDLTEKDFGDLIGKSQAAVNRYCQGERIPGKDVMTRIVTVTGGQVQPNDFFGVLPMPGPVIIPAENDAVDPAAPMERIADMLREDGILPPEAA